MKDSITPLLMFSGAHHGQAQEAINFYTSTFPNSSVTSIAKYGPGQHEPQGTVQSADFILNGQRFMAMDSAMPHPFNFTPSISFFINAEDVSEFDALIAKLSDEGEMLMPPDNYGFSHKFAWFNDRFGISWQVNCS